MYTVKYKKDTDWFWKTLKNIKGDGIVESNVARYFIMSDESRIEIPMHSHLFIFDSGRFITIKKRMESESGQYIPTKED